MSFKNIIFFLFSIALIVSGCEKTEAKQIVKSNENIVKNANGFSIYKHKNYYKLIIYRGFKSETQKADFYLFKENESIPDSLKKKQIIRIPIKKIVVTNTSHIPMLEALHAENTLQGFPNTRYVSSATTRDLIKKGSVKDLGNEQAMNLELLLDIKPDVLIGFGVDQPSKMYDNILKLGIPVIMNADWMEETPLGRAEWIKLFGVLFDKEEKADSIFHSIETNYNKLKKLAQNATTQPTVMSGSLFQDIWYVPAGKSFLAQMINDAQAEYLWKDSEGNGSLALHIEDVFAKAQQADYWIAPGNFTDYERLSQQQALLKNFNSFERKQVYSYAFQKNDYGGMTYFESSPLHPDWVLSDLIHIFHPEIRPDASLHYFKKIE